MAGVGRMLLRRVVLDVDARQAALRFAQDLVLDGLPLAARLEDDDVELALVHALDRQVVHVVAPRQGAAAAAVVLRAARVVDEMEVVRHLRQVVQVVAVHVPRQDAQASLHGATPSVSSTA